ncbi:MAG: hypothetical protein BWY75_02060 [bacterium ADurb.Bin425]|nr:MAG: hypothetical protein BWY75_02060 [bacterium ADurb.Bin425]
MNDRECAGVIKCRVAHFIFRDAKVLVEEDPDQMVFAVQRFNMHFSKQNIVLGIHQVVHTYFYMQAVVAQKHIGDQALFQVAFLDMPVFVNPRELTIYPEA